MQTPALKSKPAVSACAGGGRRRGEPFRWALIDLEDVVELLLKIAALAIVVGVTAFVLYCHWQERWGQNHY